MKHRMDLFLILVLLSGYFGMEAQQVPPGAAPAAISDKCAVTNVDYKLDDEKYKAVILENSLIKMAILPEYGGRIVEYTLKATGHNQFDSTTGNPGLKDVVGENGESGYTPGGFAQLPFKAEVSEKGKEMSVRLEASSENVKVEKIFTLTAGSTKLNIKVKYTNIGKEPIEKLLVRVHPCLSTGGNQAVDDIFVIPEPDKIKRKTTDEINKPDCGWWLAFDPRAREMLFMTFNPEGIDKLYLYLGGDAYNMEYMGKPLNAKKGDSVAVDINYFIITAGSQADKMLASGEITAFDKEKPRIKAEVKALFDNK